MYLPKEESFNGHEVRFLCQFPVNNEMVLYDKISAFYIDEYEDGNYLLYRLKNTLINPTQVIVIEPEVNIDELRAFLIQHLTEKEIKQSSTDKLINSF